MTHLIGHRVVSLFSFVGVVSIANAVQTVIGPDGNIGQGARLGTPSPIRSVSENAALHEMKMPMCTEEQRVPRTVWWQWKERLANLQASSPQDPLKDMSVSQCLQKLSGADMDWILAVDGWAQALWGADSVLEFNGTLASKNFNKANKGDFLADWRSMFERMAALGDEQLTAASLERINDPIEHQASHSKCVSDHDPMIPVEPARSVAERCPRPPAFLRDQLSVIDRKLYDSKGVRHERASSKFRAEKLAEYLGAYYQEIGNLPRESHSGRLQALSRLAWNYAWLHPFCDGNGRTRTLILNRELCRLDYHPAISFDNNFELFYQTPSMLQEQLEEAMFLWEDAYVFKCIPWTPARAASHRAKFGAKTVGMPENCSSENAHLLTHGAS